MKSKWIAIFWSVVMIAAGIVFLLREFGYLNFDQLPQTVWAIIFAVFSLFFFLTYFLQGVREWGWLFPATIFAALALIIGLAGTPLGEAITGAPIMIAIAIPFLVAFAQQPKKAWWALIPAWVMFCISLIILFSDNVSGGFVGSFVIYSVALPFLVVYLLDRSRRWALIPFGILAVVGLIPLLDDLVDGEFMGLVIMSLFAIPFYVVYFWTKKNWWALIPAGVFTSIAVVVLYSLLFGSQVRSRGVDPVGTAILLAGIGLTFGALWLRRAVQPTDWAKIPALVLLGLALLSLVMGANIGFFFPVALIAAGAVILVFGLLRKPVAKPVQAVPAMPPVSTPVTSAAPTKKATEKKQVRKKTVAKKNTG